MKKLLYVGALLICTGAMAQEKPKEVKEETEVKVVKVKDNDKTTEKKVKVITRETSTVELDDKDINKVNQDRVKSTVKVEKKVMVDDDDDDNYDFLTSETYFILGEEKYIFRPNERGFDMSFAKRNDESMKITKALTSSNQGFYIVNGEINSGIGYFDSNENFTVEYYNKETNMVEKRVYMRIE